MTRPIQYTERMLQITPPTILDQRGNLFLHAQQGTRLLVEFFDDDGDPIDMTSRAVLFETASGLIRIDLGPGDTFNSKYLDIVQDTLSDLINRISSFIVLDVTSDLHELVWQGQISVRGWK